MAEGEDKALEVGGSISTEGAAAKVQVHGKAIDAVGALGEWLFPDHMSRVRVQRAFTDRLVEKITGDQLNGLDAVERQFLEQVLRRTGQAVENEAAIIERVEQVTPEVEQAMARLPSLELGEDVETTTAFVDRAQAIAGEISDDGIADLFARLLAGEVCRPGSISIRTLEAVRSLDVMAARAFDLARMFVWAGGMFIDDGPALDYLHDSGLRHAELLDLLDAGLIDRNWHFVLDVEAEDTHEILYGVRFMVVSVGRDIRLQKSIRAMRLTRVGAELNSVLPQKADYRYFEVVGSWLSENVPRGVEITWRYDSSDGNMRSFRKGA